MMSPTGRGRLLWDLGLTALLLYAAVWIYEVSNFIAMNVASRGAVLVVTGGVPVGVVGAASGVGFGVKVLQLGLSAGTMLVLFLVSRRLHLAVATAISIGIASVYLASPYWELLSITAFLPLPVHETLYTVLAMALFLGLERFSGAPGGRRLNVTRAK